jgi:hypothetical protein
MLSYLLILLLCTATTVGNKGFRVTKTLDGLAKDIIIHIPEFEKIVESLPMDDEIEEEKNGILTTRFELLNIITSNFTVYLNQFTNTVKTAYPAHLFQIHGTGNGFSIALSMSYNVFLNKIRMSTGTVKAFLRSTSFDLFQNYGTGFPKTTLHIEWAIASINVDGEYSKDTQLADLIYKVIQYKLTNQINSYLNLKIGVIDKSVMSEYNTFRVTYPYNIAMQFDNSLYNMTPSDGNTATFSYQTTVSVVGRPDKRKIIREVYSDATAPAQDLMECYSNEMLLAVLDVQAKARYPYIYIDLKSLNLPNNVGYYKKILSSLNYIRDSEEVECGCRSNPDEEIVEIINMDDSKRMLIPVLCSFTVKSIGDNFITMHLFVNATFVHVVDITNGTLFYGIISSAHFRGFQANYQMGFYGMERMSEIIGTIVQQMNGMKVAYPSGIGHTDIRPYTCTSFLENDDDMCLGFKEATALLRNS